MFFALAASSHGQTDEGYLLESSHWLTNQVPVCWENGLAATTNSEIRILIQDAGPRTLSLGRNLNIVANRMLLNFTFSAWGSACAGPAALRQSCIEAIAIHEFGHAPSHLFYLLPHESTRDGEGHPHRVQAR